MGYWPSVRLRWLDIGQVLSFARLWTISQKENKVNIKPVLDRTQSWPYTDLACLSGQSQCRIWFILSNQDVWILAKFFFYYFACLWADTELRSINSQREQGQFSAILTEQARSMGDLLYGFQGNFSCMTQWVVQSRQDTVESRFYEPPRETTFGSKNRRVWEIRGKITVFDWGGPERTFGSSYREVRKTEGSRNRDATVAPSCLLKRPITV